MAIRIVSLGVQTIRFGVRGDTERGRKLVGDFHHWLGEAGLDISRFEPSREQDPERYRSRVGIGGWLEDEEGKERQAELLAANFGIDLPDYAAMLEAAAAAKELEDCLRGGFPHLATQFSVEKVDALYRLGILWLETTDENSLWRSDYGYLCAPYLYCYPYYRRLSACWVEHKRYAYDWFLFFRE